MDNIKLLIITFIFFVLFSSAVLSQLNIGVSPGFIDLDEVERGSTNIVKFFIVSISDDNLIVGMSATKGNEKVFERSGYRDKLLNYSEEDPSDWVDFISNPVLLKPNESTISGRPTIKGWKEVKFILRIPEDAEPGYHVLTIYFDPRAAPEYDKPVVIKTVIPLNVIFNVPGPAIREGKILDITRGNYVNNKLELNIFFENTGTTTMLTHGDVVRIYDGEDEIKALPSTFNLIKPDEVKIFKAYWDTDGLEFKYYRVTANFSYRTGTAAKESIISLYELPPTAYVVKEYVFPWWWILIPILSIIIGYVIYRWYSG